MRQRLIPLALILASCSSLPAATFANRLPNIVFVLADDLGYADVKSFGLDRCQIETPNFDRLAQEGMRFTNAYAIASVCVPSRMSFIRTANSPRGHAKLRLRNFTGKNCEAPVKISNTRDITIDALKVLNHRSQKYPPISFENCQGVHLENVSVETAHFGDQPVRWKNCADVRLSGIELLPTK